MIISNMSRIFGSGSFRLAGDRTHRSTVGKDGSSSGTVPPAPNLSPIDLTAGSLDSRVTYSGPAHTFINSNGNLITSSVNEWPLEYANGVAIGRHEPEHAATNFQPDSAFASISETQEGQNTVWIASQSASITVTPSDDGSFFAMEVGKFGWSHTGVYSLVTNTFILSDSESPIGEDWTLTTRTFTNGALAVLRFYIARVNATNYLYGLEPELAAGDYVASVWRKEGGDTLTARAAQIEAGTVSTSPIFNGVSEQNSRAASSVVVTNPGGATGIVIHYSDGTTATASFTNNSASVPLASLPWGTRYITQITYSS